ncbi:MAG: PilN domain-containing protein [Pseudomonadota bacterium]
MARINLLPWRQWERERKQKTFVASLAAVLLTGVAAIFLAGTFFQGEVDEQIALNSRLQTDIATLDGKIKEIATLEREREELLSRMRVIQELQGNRPVIVRVFDELARTLSRGVHFNSLKMQATQLSVSGVAESNNRISSLMRNLDKSDWFASPNLRSIQEDPGNGDYGDQASNFELTFVQSSPKGTKEGS